MNNILRNLLIIFFIVTPVEIVFAEVDWLPSFNEFIDLTTTSDPDFSALEMSYIAYTHHAKWGSNIGLLKINSKIASTIFTINTFVELYNSTELSFISIPNELWRGNVGFYFYNKLNIFRNYIDETTLKIGAYHESTHHTLFAEHYDADWLVYEDEGRTLFTPNTSDSFECIDLRLNLKRYFYNNYNVILTLGVKDYYDIFDENLFVFFENAFNVELILEKTCSNNKNNSIFCSIYYENINRNLGEEIEKQFGGVENYRWFWDSLSSKRSNTYFIIKIGINFKKNTILQPYLMYSVSNGRGIDYLVNYSGFGIGIRMVPN